MTAELLAQLVEVSSVIATGGKVGLKEPFEVPRPEYLRQPAAAPAGPAVAEIDPAWTKAFIERRRMHAWGNTSDDDVGVMSRD